MVVIFPCDMPSAWISLSLSLPLSPSPAWLPGLEISVPSSSFIHCASVWHFHTCQARMATMHRHPCILTLVSMPRVMVFQLQLAHPELEFWWVRKFCKPQLAMAKAHAVSTTRPTAHALHTLWPWIRRQKRAMGCSCMNGAWMPMTYPSCGQHKHHAGNPVQTSLYRSFEFAEKPQPNNEIQITSVPSLDFCLSNL